MKLAQLFQLMNLIDELKKNKVVCYLYTSIGFNSLGDDSCDVISYVIVGSSTMNLDTSSDNNINCYLNAIRSLLAKLEKEVA